jgi:hypothetical protein
MLSGAKNDYRSVSPDVVSRNSKAKKSYGGEVVRDRNVALNLIPRWIRRSLCAKLPLEVFIVHSISVRIY